MRVCMLRREWHCGCGPRHLSPLDFDATIYSAKNIVIKNIDSIWQPPFARELPVTQLHSILFKELAEPGDRPGMLECDGSGGNLGNGVLVSRPQNIQLKLCMEKMKHLYYRGTSGKRSWSTKRGYGGMRMYLTVNMSGPQVIYDTTEPEQLYLIKESKYFEEVDARALSYTRRPALMRWDSVPDLKR